VPPWPERDQRGQPHIGAEPKAHHIVFACASFRGWTLSSLSLLDHVWWVSADVCGVAQIIPLTEQLEFVAELIDVLATLLQSPPNHEKCHKLFVAE